MLKPILMTSTLALGLAFGTVTGATALELSFALHTSPPGPEFQAVDKFVSGESDNVHQMMMALQKADVSFQLMMQVRNKLVAAYEDIQRMQM